MNVYKRRSGLLDIGLGLRLGRRSVWRHRLSYMNDNDCYDTG
jgi:hypothetical protein